jgi:hypothetical protein
MFGKLIVIDRAYPYIADGSDSLHIRKVAATVLNVYF